MEPNFESRIERSRRSYTWAGLLSFGAILATSTITNQWTVTGAVMLILGLMSGFGFGVGVSQRFLTFMAPVWSHSRHSPAETDQTADDTPS